jgi:hypothetical protein
VTTDPRHPSLPSGARQADSSPRLTLVSSSNGETEDEFVDDHSEATDRLLEMISAVEFLRRGDRRGLTLWAALEEALRWWTAERAALLDGHAEPVLRSARLGGSEALPGTVIRFVAVAGQNEPVHLHLALQQALRRWTAAMADRYNEGQPWPPPLPRRAPTPTQLHFDTDEPPDLIA